MSEKKQPPKRRETSGSWWATLGNAALNTALVLGLYAVFYGLVALVTNLNLEVLMRIVKVVGIVTGCGLAYFGLAVGIGKYLKWRRRAYPPREAL